MYVEVNFCKIGEIITVFVKHFFGLCVYARDNLINVSRLILRKYCTKNRNILYWEKIQQNRNLLNTISKGIFCFEISRWIKNHIKKYTKRFNQIFFALKNWTCSSSTWQFKLKKKHWLLNKSQFLLCDIFVTCDRWKHMMHIFTSF